MVGELVVGDLVEVGWTYFVRSRLTSHLPGVPVATSANSGLSSVVEADALAPTGYSRRQPCVPVDVLHSWLPSRVCAPT